MLFVQDAFVRRSSRCLMRRNTTLVTNLIASSAFLIFECGFPLMMFINGRKFCIALFKFILRKFGEKIFVPDMKANS